MHALLLPGLLAEAARLPFPAGFGRRNGDENQLSHHAEKPCPSPRRNSAQRSLQALGSPEGAKGPSPGQLVKFWGRQGAGGRWLGEAESPAVCDSPAAP